MTIPLRGAWIMQHKSSHHFLGYWDKLRDANALPDWTDFDPRAIKDLLPNVLILDVQNMAQPKYRYAGTALCERHGCDLAGANFLSGWDLQSASTIAALFGRAVESKRPVCLSSIGRAGEAGIVQVETVLAPIRFRDEEFKIFLGISEKLSDQRTLADQPITGQRLTTSRLVRENDAHLVFRSQQHIPIRALMSA